MYARYASALGTASLTTLALLYLMQLLIQSQGIAPSVADRVPGLLRPVRIVEPPESPADPAPPVPLDVPPPQAPGDGLIVERLAEPVDIPPAPPVVPAGPLAVPRSAPLDGPLVLLAQARPAYPPGLLQQGIEGWVEVRFDVAADGTVENLRVLRSSNPGFEKSAGAAAERLRFRPRTVGGEPQVTYGVSKRFVYRLENR